LLVGRARETLPKLGLAHLIAGDSVEFNQPVGLPFTTVSLAPLIASAIGHLHRDESLPEMRYPG
jgi:phosphoribosylpyrophosphate synthetase